MKSKKLWISFLLFEMISLFITSCSFEKKDNMPIILVTLSSISVTSKPTKTSYIIGEEFDKSGMVVKAYYTDLTNKDVTDNVKISGFDNTKKDSLQKITVEYTENEITKTDYFYVSIKEPEPKIEYEITYKNVESWVNSIGTTWVQVIAEIKNTGTVPIYLSSSSYDLEDANGQLIASKQYISTYPDVIKSGEKGYMYDETTLENSVQGNINVIPRINAKKATVSCIRYDVSEISISDTTYNGPKMIGRITNTTSKDEDGLIYVVGILYNSNEKPIGVLLDIITDDLAAGNRIGFTATSLCLPNTVNTNTINNFKVYAYPKQLQLN